MTFLTDCIACVPSSVCLCLPLLRCRLLLAARQQCVCLAAALHCCGVSLCGAVPSAVFSLHANLLPALLCFCCVFPLRQLQYYLCMPTCFLRCCVTAECFRCVDCRSVVDHCRAIVDVRLLCFASVLPSCRCDFDRCFANGCCLACYVLHVIAAGIKLPVIACVQCCICPSPLPNANSLLAL